MKTIVWYGAGQNLKDNFDCFEQETGLPVCICDSDETKQNTIYEISRGGENKCSILAEGFIKIP